MAWIRNAARRLVEAEKRFEHDVLWGTLFDMKFFSHRYQRRSIQEASQYSTGVLLDVGCAKRPYENTFRPYISHYFGGDYPPGAEERRVPTEKVDVWLDGHQLPFASGCIDTVMNLNVLEHVTSPWKVTSEIGRFCAQVVLLLSICLFFIRSTVLQITFALPAAGYY